MAKVCVCGAAGGIGQPLSLLLKRSLPAGSELRLLDLVNTPGVAADLSDVPSAVRVSAHLTTSDEAAAGTAGALADADVVVIPAGVPRKPGMTRDDLFAINAGIVAGLVQSVAEHCPTALVAIITNPVNSMVPVAAGVLKEAGCYDPKRLFGVSTLDVVRAQTYLGQIRTDITDPSAIHIPVIGGHSADTMLPIFSQAAASTGGASLNVTAAEQEALTKRVQNAGTVVVEAKAGAGSATLSMAHAGAHFALALVRALKGESGITECAYVDLSDDADAVAPYCCVPVTLGTGGVATCGDIGDLNEFEKGVLAEAVPILKGHIAKGEQFVKDRAAKAGAAAAGDS